MKPFFWLDLEMTGLDDTVDVILEVAVAITDPEFKILEEYNQVIYQPQGALDRMDKWCQKTHGASGLTKRVKTGTPLNQAEEDLLKIVDRHYKSSDRVVLCGNSIGNDKRFIDRYMPKFAKRLHYRLIDVSSFKEVFKRKYGIKVDKKKRHRALDDIYESIEELKTYLGYVKIEKK